MEERVRQSQIVPHQAEVADLLQATTPCHLAARALLGAFRRRATTAVLEHVVHGGE